MDEQPEPCILIIGDPMLGYRYYGPYRSFAAAQRFAERLKHTDWWIAPLEPKREATHA